MRRGLLSLFLLAAALVPCRADSAVELFVAAPGLPPVNPSIGAALELESAWIPDERWALRASVGLEGSASPVDGSFAGDGDGCLELSLAAGDWVAVLRLTGTARVSSAGEPAELRSDLGLTLTRDGQLASVAIEPWIGVGVMAEPLLEAGARSRVSVLAGELLFEPGLGGSVCFTAAGERTVSLEPGVRASWYPAVPFSAEVGGRWSATVDRAGSWSQGWGLGTTISGAPANGLLASLDLALELEAGELDADGSLELELVLWSEGDRAVSVPLRATASFSPAEGASATGALGVRFEW